MNGSKMDMSLHVALTLPSVNCTSCIIQAVAVPPMKNKSDFRKRALQQAPVLPSIIINCTSCIVHYFSRIFQFLPFAAICVYSYLRQFVVDLPTPIVHCTSCIVQAVAVPPMKNKSDFRKRALQQAPVLPSIIINCTSCIVHYFSRIFQFLPFAAICVYSYLRQFVVDLPTPIVHCTSCIIHHPNRLYRSSIAAPFSTYPQLWKILCG